MRIKRYAQRANLLMGLGAGMILGAVNVSGSREAAFVVGLVVLIAGFAVLEFGREPTD